MLNRLMNIAEVCMATTLSEPNIYKWMRENRFPKPLKISEIKRNVWRESTIENWINDNTKEAA